MLVSSSNILEAATKSLRAAGLDKENCIAIAENVVVAEALGRPSHGLLSCLLFHKYRGSWTPPVDGINIVGKGIITVTASRNSGCLAMREGVRAAISALSNSESPIVALRISNFQATVGYAGHYGRMAAEAGCFYLGYHTCHGGLSVSGLPEGFLSTNPFVIASPSNEGKSVVYDSSCAEGSWSERYRQNLLSGMDEDGISVLPWGGGKGSGLSIAVECLVSSLTETKAFDAFSESGLGSLAILIRHDSSLTRRETSVPPSLLLALNAAETCGVRVPGFSGPPLSKVFQETTMIDVNEKIWSMVTATFDL